MILLLAIAGAILAAWTFAGLLLLIYRPSCARYTSVSLASQSGELADRYGEMPTDLAGLDVSRLDHDCYLLQTPEWGSGTVADANLYGLTYAIVEVRGRRWSMDVRANAGYQLIWIVALFGAIWSAATQHPSIAGRIGQMLFGTLVAYAVPSWRRRVRNRFAIAAEELGSSQADAARAAESSL